MKQIKTKKKKKIITVRLLAEYYGISQVYFRRKLKKQGVDINELRTNVYYLMDYVAAHPPRHL